MLMKLNAKNIFLIDGIGAILSTVSTGLVLSFFTILTGIPISVSSALASLGLVFAIYSFSCYAIVKQIKPWMLAAIIIANVSYCLIATIIAFTINVTHWGQVYFIAEVLIVVGVVIIELSVYRQAFRKSSG
jgi:hypothetical protein